jgi:hypothetical protein
MWDERFSEPGYAYGTEPNEFLVSVADRIPGGRVLCLAEGRYHRGTAAVVQILALKPSG